ncbi:hypothetical protein ACFL0R_01090 [Pseudomonadota bacterium]
MSKNQKIIVALTFLFFLIFSCMVIAGIDLTYKSIIKSGHNASETNVAISVSDESLEIDFTTAMPGIVFVIIGGAGLILMVYKVPAKEMLGYQSAKSGSDDVNLMDYSRSTPQKPLYSERITKIPLPVWWVIKGKHVFARLDGNV